MTRLDLIAALLALATLCLLGLSAKKGEPTVQIFSERGINK
jgi:hypothetical protein